MVALLSSSFRVVFHRAGLVLILLFMSTTWCLGARGFTHDPISSNRDYDYWTKIDANQLGMFLTNRGSFSYNVSSGWPGLEFPRGSDKHAVFAAGIWVGAEVSGDSGPRVTVAEYSFEYAGGKIEADGSYDPDWGNNPRWRVYKIHSGRIPYPAPDYTEWPVEDGAPVDGSGNPRHLGSQTCWAVYHDADWPSHTNSAGGTLPLGIEVQQTTFAREETAALRNTIFMEWKIIHKGTESLESTYISIWVDPDLGQVNDDLVGCDPPDNLGFAYNATNLDAEYLTRPPAVGIQLLQGPIVPSPGDEAYVSGRIIPDYRNLPATSFTKYINGTDPERPTESYNYMQGLESDGSSVINPLTGEPTTYQVSGDPVAGEGWLDTNPADRRMMLSTGPFEMAPGDTQIVAFAIVVGQGSDRLDSITKLRSTASQATGLFRAIYSEDPGACCLPDGSCSVVDEDECVGEFLVGEVCDPDPCHVVEGACCLVYGGCIVVAPEDCPDDYLGDGTACDPGPCPEPITGACCVESACFITLVTDCHGVFQGIGTECGLGACGANSWEWDPDPRWLSGVDFGLSTFFGGVGFGWEFFGSTLPTEEVADTEIRFDDNGYRWSECMTYRRDLGYVAAGIGIFPGSAWDISDPDSPRRVNLCFVEMEYPPDFENPEGYPANLWWEPFRGPDGAGGREYLFIMKSDYNGGIDYDDDNFGPEADVMWAAATQLRGSHVFLETVPAYFRLFVGTLDPDGACCLPDGTCILATPAGCPGVFQGDSSVCDPNPCEIASGVDDDDSLSVTKAFLRAPSPNPTGRSTLIRFGLPTPGRVEIRIYNVAGALVRTLVDGVEEAGSHHVTWDLRDDRGREVVQGTFYVRMMAEEFDTSRKIVLAR